MAHVMPEHAARVKRYRDDAALFSRFQIEHQIESAYARTVQLPSGGAIVIDHTEALVSVDVNSARAIKGGDIEETATRTNLEAADEVARQMRLRDLGGLIVIDFIDMDESKNRREVESRLRDALRQDRARVQFGSISKFGLMEMSRQRLKPALSEGSSIPCPRCGGSGHIRDTESSALQILRIIQEECLKDNTAAVHVQVPVDVASFLLNEKRPEIAKIELKQRVTVVMKPNKTLETPNYRLERLKHDDPRLDHIEASYKVDEIEDPTSITRRSQEPTNKQTPVIKGVLPDAPAPVAVPKPEPVRAAAPVAAPAPVAPPTPAPAPAAAETGFIGWLKSLFGGASAPAATSPAPVTPTATSEETARQPRRESGRGGEGRGARDGEQRRGGRGGRDGEARSGRDGERRGGRAGGSSERREPREARETQQPREPRPPRDGERRGGRGERRDSDSRALSVAADDAQGDQLAMPGAQAVAGEPAIAEQRAPRARGERRERGERSDRGGEGRRERRGGEGVPVSNEAPRADTDSVAEQTTAVAPADDVAETQRPESEERRGRSRDRYGRDRRERAPRDTSETSAVAAEAVDGSHGSDETPSRLANAPAHDLAPMEALAAAAPREAVIAVQPPAASASIEVLAPSSTRRGLPKVTPFDLPLAQLAQIAEGSGLHWVNSDADRIAQAQAAIAAEPLPVRIPRERPPAVVLDEGPLVLVETRKNLSGVILPFERSAAQDGSQI
ncbi:MAG: ribonuclease E/G, partial [Variovorax sp.]